VVAGGRALGNRREISEAACRAESDHKQLILFSFSAWER
jgi:hypothetical protein